MRGWLAALLALGVVGCTTSTQQAASRVVLTVSPSPAVLDTPVHIEVTGLEPNSTVTLSASAVDADGVSWTSHARFAASRQGSVNASQAPLPGGSYSGADAMGLFEHLTPSPPSSYPGGSWFYPGNGGYVVALNAQIAGRVVAATTVERLDATEVGVKLIKIRPRSDGVYADLYLPAHVLTRHPAVLVLGGSEGGISADLNAALLAAHGYPAMALAYFDEPGLPKHLERIPLEYFVRALRILRDEPGVDPTHVFTWGVSRGSEAALLLGAHFPQLVQGVIAAVPSSVVNGSLPAGGAAWTLGGRPLPSAPGWARPGARLNTAAVIPVEKIRGPIFLVCGRHDLEWPSCPFSDAIVARLNAHHDRYAHLELRYPEAGHSVGVMLPYESRFAPVNSAPFDPLGGTTDANTAASDDAWKHLLTWLAQPDS